MALQDVLTELKKVSLVANTEVPADPVETLNGRRGRQRAAKEKLTKLREDYSNGLLSSAVFIVVTGSLAKEFSEASTGDASTGEKLGCFTADPEDFYRELVAPMPTALFGREGNGSLFDILSRHLEDKANNLGIIGYPQLQFKKGYTSKVSNREDFVQLVKRAINEQVGAEIVAIQSVRSLVDKAIEKNHKALITPIVLATTDEKFALDLGIAIQSTSTKVFTVVAGESTNPELAARTGFTLSEVSKESVTATLKKIVKKVNKQ